MADDWDAVDQVIQPKAKALALDSWDDDPPDSWDAPASKNGGSSKKAAETASKGAAASTKQVGSKTKVGNADSKQGLSRPDKALEKAQIDLSHARDVAEFISSDSHGAGDFELLQPSSKAQFDILLKLLLDKFATCRTSPEFNPFVESLFRKVANELDMKTLKAVSNTLAMIVKDKELAEKASAQKNNAAANNAIQQAVKASVPKAPVAVVKKQTRTNIKVGSVYDTYDQDDAFDDDEFDDFRPVKSNAPKLPAPAATGGYYDDEGEI